VERAEGGTVILIGENEERLDPVDEVIATTGFRPDLTLLSELRLGLDPSVEAPTVLAPMIDPNLHSCGTVRPHGAAELSHPEKDFYIAGMKSYGRAPTFLLLTGYEQVRSIVCQLTGDVEGAREVRLELPETGVCNQDRNEPEKATVACCGVASPAATAAKPASAGCGCDGDSCGIPASSAGAPRPKAGCCG
jgi:hypothetical protein